MSGEKKTKANIRNTYSKPASDQGILFASPNDPMPIIKLSHISKRFGLTDQATCALDDVDLEIQRGEFVAIMGPSGCGKTTLLNTLGLLEKPDSGEYLFNGRNVERFSENRKARIRNSKIGFIFQNFNLVSNLTVLENVVLPLYYRRGWSYKSLERASELLKTFGLALREYYMPNQLSGGQMQRVAIARALINAPQIILADEPTGNLDSRNSDIIMQELTRLHRTGNTILMVTHNPDLLKYASRVINMKDGRIDRDEELTETAAFRVTKRTISTHRREKNRRYKRRIRRTK